MNGELNTVLRRQLAEPGAIQDRRAIRISSSSLNECGDTIEAMSQSPEFASMIDKLSFPSAFNR